MATAECALDLEAIYPANDAPTSGGLGPVELLRPHAAMKINAGQADSASGAGPRRTESVKRLYELMEGREWQEALDQLDAMDMPPGHIAYHRGVALSFMGRHTQ